MNKHITVCCYGKSTDQFNNDIFKCSIQNKRVVKEPYFKVYASMAFNNANKLLSYKSYTHKLGFDTMNF